MTGMEILVTVVGSIGAVALLVSYVLISKKRIKGDSYTYQILNLTGALLLIVNGFYFKAYPSGVLNIIWGSLASYEIWKISKKTPQGG